MRSMYRQDIFKDYIKQILGTDAVQHSAHIGGTGGVLMHCVAQSGHDAAFGLVAQPQRTTAEPQVNPDPKAVRETS